MGKEDSKFFEKLDLRIYILLKTFAFTYESYVIKHHHMSPGIDESLFKSYYKHEPRNSLVSLRQLNFVAQDSRHSFLLERLKNESHL